jgi:hypothetical protein
VPSYLVETYLARADAGEREARAHRARASAEQLSSAGTPVRLEHAIHVPDDELCFFLFEATAGPTAALVALLADLAPIRIVEAVPLGDIT